MSIDISVANNFRNYNYIRTYYFDQIHTEHVFWNNTLKQVLKLSHILIKKIVCLRGSIYFEKITQNIGFGVFYELSYS